MQFFHCLDDLIEFGLLILIDFIDQVLPYHRFIRGNNHDFQFINLIELFCLGNGCAGHTGQLAVHAEIILESNRRIGPRLFFNLNARSARHFFRFNRLMQTIGIPAAVHHPAGKFINNHNFSVVDDVFLVFFV